MFHITKGTLAAATVIAAAAVPSSASARFDLEPAGGASAAPIANPPAAAQPEAPSSEEFRWGDAGIGAAGMLGLIGTAGATAVLVRRRREHHTPAS
jgi:hypothetical protein